MDALLVSLEAVDTFEVLIAIGTFPHGFVRMGKEMTTKMHWFATQIAASSVRTRDRFGHPGSRRKRNGNASLTAEKCCFTLSSCKGGVKVHRINGMVESGMVESAVAESMTVMSDRWPTTQSIGKRTRVGCSVGG